MTKQELISKVKYQLNIDLVDESNVTLKCKKNIMYIDIPKKHKLALLGYFEKHGIRYESHIKDYYFVYCTSK